MKPTCKWSVSSFVQGQDRPTSRRTLGAPEQLTMGEQLELLNTLDDALLYFRRIERERNEALTQLRALEQDVNTLRALLPQANPKTGMVKCLRTAADSATFDLDGLYNNGYRDRVLKRLAATLAQEPDPELRRWVALALGVMGDTRSVPALALALNDVNTGVRREAAVALGRIGTAHVVSPLAGELRGSRQGSARQGDKSLGKDGEARDPRVDFRVRGPQRFGAPWVIGRSDDDRGTGDLAAGEVSP